MPKTIRGKTSLVVGGVLSGLLGAAFIPATAAAAGLASNANFAVWADSQPLSEEILYKADTLRREIAKNWLGKLIPDGFGRASINVYFSQQDSSRTWIADGRVRDTHMMWIYTTPEKLDTALAHELTHVVLANRFPHLPPWAQEGCASSCDDEQRRGLRRQALQWFAETGQWPQLEQLFGAEKIDASNQSAYTAAVSVTEFLLGRSDGNRQKFLAFASLGQQNGDWNAALVRHYQIANVDSLQALWQEWAAQQLRVGDARGP